MSKTIKLWNESLPDPAAWQPRRHTGTEETLQLALQQTCRAVQLRIISEAAIERQFNIDNYDSGAAIEDLVRRELRKLLPMRYDISAGVLNDATGSTVGDCDVLISNRTWAPVIKLGATEESRRVHFPVESTYAVLEVKQTATFNTIDDAMEKLVSAARLRRAEATYGQLTENECLSSCDQPGRILNPLFTAIMCARPDPKVPFSELTKRFFSINQEVARSGSRDQLVKALCVFEAGLAFYSTVEGKNADFSRDRHVEIVETQLVSRPKDSFYLLFVYLLGHLTRSVLMLTDVPHMYGDVRAQVIFGNRCPPTI